MKTTFIVILYIITFQLLVVEGRSDDILLDQSALFNRNHPEEERHYKFLAPTSIEYIKYVHETEQSMIQGTLAAIRANNDQEKLDDFLNKLEERNQEGNKQVAEFLKSFAEKIDVNDRLFYFSYEKESYRDYGLLVIRDGSIVYRERWGFSSEPGAGLPEMDELEFDDL